MILKKFKVNLRLFFLHILKIALQLVVRIGLGLQVSINLTNLLANNIRDIFQRLLNRIFSHVPLKLGDVTRQVI